MKRETLHGFIGITFLVIVAMIIYLVFAYNTANLKYLLGLLVLFFVLVFIGFQLDKKAMAITINQVDDKTITVNGKEVILDMDNNWIAHEELTNNEISAFKQHLNSLKVKDVMEHKKLGQS